MKDGHASPSASSAATTMTSAATGSWARIGPAARSSRHPAISHSPLPERGHAGGQPDRVVDTSGIIPSGAAWWLTRLLAVAWLTGGPDTPGCRADITTRCCGAGDPQDA